jgi:hypothetical protein
MFLQSLLPLIIASPGFLVGMEGLTESIHVSDSLVIVSEYAPENAVLRLEAMLLSVEDFAIIQAEVESSLSTCNTRLNDLSTKHKETIDAIQMRCEERHSVLKLELKESLALNKQLSTELKASESSARWHKWLNIGLVVGASAAATWAISK